MLLCLVQQEMQRFRSVHRNIWFSDGAHFQLDGRVNSRNHCFWRTEPTEEVVKRPLHSQRCTVSCAISAQGISRPIWMEDGAGNTATVTAMRYREILQRFWSDLGTRYSPRSGPTEDPVASAGRCAIPPCNRDQGLASRSLPGPCNRKGVGIEWPAHCPDSTPPDFFLWGHLKSKV